MVGGVTVDSIAENKDMTLGLYIFAVKQTSRAL